MKSKLFTGVVNVYLADSLVFSLDNIKVGKKENVIALDSLHQTLVGKDHYGKNIRITYTRNGIELGELIVQQAQYEIRTGKDLQGVSLDLDGEYTQMNDIIIQDKPEEEENTIENFITEGGFKPIGGENNPFMGKYNGQNFEIQNLSIFSTEEYTALFPVLGENAMLQNINIELKQTGEELYFAISGNKYTAVLVGANNSGIIENCHVKGAAIKGTDIIGGLVAYNAGIIILSSADVFVQSKSDGLADGGVVGGLVGFNNAGTIDASKSANTVEGNQATFVGGLVGKSVLSIITVSHSTAKVSGMKIVGGFIGSNEEGSISHSTVQSENISGVKYLGGFIGQNKNSLIMLCSAVANVTGTQYVGGFIGINENANIIGSFSNGNIRGEKIVAGFIGENITSQIMYSYSMGEVYVNSKNGAEFIGISKKSNIKGCFSLSKATGSGLKKHFIANLKGGTIVDSYYVSAENSGKKPKKNQATPLKDEVELMEKMAELTLNLESGIELSKTPQDNKPFVIQDDEVRLWWEI